MLPLSTLLLDFRIVAVYPALITSYHCVRAVGFEETSSIIFLLWLKHTHTHTPLCYSLSYPGRNFAITLCMFKL